MPTESTDPGTYRKRTLLEPGKLFQAEHKLYSAHAADAQVLSGTTLHTT